MLLKRDRHDTIALIRCNAKVEYGSQGYTTYKLYLMTKSDDHIRNLTEGRNKSSSYSIAFLSVIYSCGLPEETKSIDTLTVRMMEKRSSGDVKVTEKQPECDK